MTNPGSVPPLGLAGLLAPTPTAPAESEVLPGFQEALAALTAGSAAPAAVGADSPVIPARSAEPKDSSAGPAAATIVAWVAPTLLGSLPILATDPAATAPADVLAGDDTSSLIKKTNQADDAAAGAQGAFNVAPWIAPTLQPGITIPLTFDNTPATSQPRVFGSPTGVIPPGGAPRGELLVRPVVLPDLEAPADITVQVPNLPVQDLLLAIPPVSAQATAPVLTPAESTEPASSAAVVAANVQSEPAQPPVTQPPSPDTVAPGAADASPAPGPSPVSARLAVQAAGSEVTSVSQADSPGPARALDPSPNTSIGLANAPSQGGPRLQISAQPNTSAPNLDPARGSPIGPETDPGAGTLPPGATEVANPSSPTLSFGDRLTAMQSSNSDGPVQSESANALDEPAAAPTAAANRQPSAQPLPSTPVTHTELPNTDGPTARTDHPGSGLRGDQGSWTEGGQPSGGGQSFDLRASNGDAATMQAATPTSGSTSSDFANALARAGGPTDGATAGPSIPTGPATADPSRSAVPADPFLTMADRLAELRSAVADQVVQRASFLRFPDRTEMTVELRPPELGHVHLHLVDDRGSMTVRFNAHDPQAQQVLAGSMEHLAARLHDQGHSVQFDLAWEQREQRTTQDRDDEPGSLPQEQSEQNDDTPEAQVRTPAFSGNRGGRVDFRA